MGVGGAEAVGVGGCDSGGGEVGRADLAFLPLMILDALQMLTLILEFGLSSSKRRFPAQAAKLRHRVGKLH